MKLKHLLFIFTALVLISCAKESKPLPKVFDLLGKWGDVAVTYINPDNSTIVFEEMGDGHYYSYWTFQVTGVLIEEAGSDGSKQYGTYVYDENKKKLTYLYEGKTRPVEAWITVNSPASMTVVVDYKEVGKTIKTMRKVDW